MLRLGALLVVSLATACGSAGSEASQAPGSDAGVDSHASLPDASTDATAAADGDDAKTACSYAAAPELVLGEEATGRGVSLATRGGGYIFSTWRGKTYSGDTSRLYRTSIQSRESQLIYEASRALSLIGANDDRVFLGEGGEYLADVLELDHAGAVQVSHDVSAEPRPAFGLRSGQAVYALEQGKLSKLTASGWQTVTAAPGMSFVSQIASSTLIAYDGDRRQLCVLDEAKGAFEPCVSAPTQVGDLNPLYSVVSAVHQAGAWALLGVTANGGAISLRAADTWTPEFVTQHQSTLNDVGLVNDQAVWLDQQSIDQNTFESSLSTATSAAWTVPGQAYALLDLGGCGLGLVIKRQGLYFVAKP